MNVYFGSSAQRIEEFKDTYQEVRRSILEAGHSLTRDWVEDSVRRNKVSTKNIKRGKFYEEVMDAIIHADVVVFDATVPSMAIGHQITFSLDKSKPTLMLIDRRVQDVANLFISGAHSPLLIAKNYSDANDAARITSEFLIDGLPQSRVRFNLVLDRIQYNYIEWAVYRYKLNKTDVIKGALSQRINSDEHYKNHISNS